MRLFRIFRLIRLSLISMFILLFSSTSFSLAQADSDLRTITHDELERSYVLHVPTSYDAAVGAPLLIALHQTGSSARAMAALTGLNPLADEYGFIVAYPNSYDPSFNDGRTAAGVGSQPNNADDVAFIAALIDELSEEFTLSGVYLTGHGTGGLFAFRLACEAPALVDGIAVVGARLWGYQRDRCEAEPSAFDLLVINGSEEPQVLIEDPNAPEVLSNVNTAGFWAARHDCADTNSATVDNALLLTGCANDTRVATYTVSGAEQRDWPQNRAGDYALNRFQVDASEMLLQFFTHDDAWQVEQPQITRTIPRTHILYVPNSYDPSEPTPLVLVLHGRPSNGFSMVYITEMNTVAEKEGFIAVYPHGVQQEWNYPRGVAMYGSGEVDDTEFLLSLIDDLSIDLNIDQTRLYVTGFSNGGFMTHRLTCEASDRFAAFAPVGASAFGGQPTLCENKKVRPLPILLMHGTEDISVPWAGSYSNVPSVNGPQKVYSTYPFETTVNFWAEVDQCDATINPEREEIPQSGNSPDTSVQKFTLLGCAKGSAIEVWVVSGGGHNWPGVPGTIPEEIAGKVNMDIHASEVIWDFFKKFTLPENE